MTPVTSALRLRLARWLAVALVASSLGVALLPLAAGAAPRKKAPKAAPSATPTAVKTFDFANVSAAAEQLAKAPFRDPRGQVPPWLGEITYDQWRDVRFRPEHSLWRDQSLPFEVQFFHPGLYYDRIIKVNQVDPAGIHPIAFSPSHFDYGQNKFASQVPQDLGYAGFRLHYPLKTKQYKDELIVFLGASYFRALGKQNVFGLSARGLAIDTAVPAGEEFPYFREFWLVRPARTAKEMVIYAVLDSPRLTGAYRFVIHPGEKTLVDVRVQIFLRERVEKLGIAPLTSMFFHGENTDRFFSDYRPEVHDSDGLLVSTASNEWIWRPLDNPRRLSVTSFQGASPKGFGLIQRDRSFDHYQDLEAQPQMRPSAWIVPSAEWGEGSIELVEIPSNSDINDNMVAYWVPKTLPEIGKPFEISYQIAWFTEDPQLPPAGRVEATRRDAGTQEDLRRFVIDFNGKELKSLPPETVLRGVVTAGQPGQAELVEQQVQKVPENGMWRLVFQVKPLRSEPIELRAFLQQGDKTLTETWAFVLQPQ
ncbi:MAG TPA: glucan biosynthesis protein G [Terriglobales bacterium]|nr:glucan biosynthesis protein G [Terriglobales bacterium]